MGETTASDDLLVGEAERDNEVVRILSCFKLNPYEHLNLPFDSSVDDVEKQYRNLSLLVHPDKCKHPQAQEAFGALAKAQQLLLDPQERGYLLSQITAAKEELLAQWKKQVKKDTASKLKSLVDEKYTEKHEQSEEFQKQLKLKVRQNLTDQEWRRRKMAMRISEEEGRLKKDEEEQKETWKKKCEPEEKWEGAREKRGSCWRDFMESGKKASREELQHARDSGEGGLPESSGSAVEASVDDGNLDSRTKSTNVDGQPGEASSDDDWEAKADCEPDQLLPSQQLDWEAKANCELDEMLPSQQLPEVSKLSLKDSVKEVPKRRGRGTFSYKKEGLVADQLSKESAVCNSEHEVPDEAKEDSTRKSTLYGTRHVLVLDGFNPSYNTIDLENIFKNFKDQSFVIRWVNDTVALAVFRSPSTALEARNSINFPFSVRVLEEDDILTSSLPSRDLEPPRQRPKTSVRTAQRLIAQGMGIKMPLMFGSEQLRRQEEARKNRIVTRRHLKDDAWGADD